ncbi:MAG: hypothetical protein IJ192_03380 [Clostridia bacterium]|nr:hypothetical protein [Clostridia bacterium]
MKKSMKIVTVLLAAMLSVGVFAACSNNEKTDSNNSTPAANADNNDNSDIGNEAVGTYKGQYTKFVGDSDDAKVTDEPFSLELQTGGKGTHYRDDLEINITWELDGENFIMTESFMGMKTEYTGTLKDGKLNIFNGDPTDDWTCEYVYEKE